MDSGNPVDNDDSVDDSVIVRMAYDWTTTRPSIAVVETVAAADDCDPTALEPLFNTLDSEALDTLIRSGNRGAAADIRVSFALDEYEVVVRTDGVGSGSVVVGDPD